MPNLTAGEVLARSGEYLELSDLTLCIEDKI